MADALAKGKKPQTTAEKKGGEDAFIEGTLRLWSWMGDNLRTVLLGLGVLAIAALGVLYYVNFQASVREQAAAELATLRMSGQPAEVLVPELEAYVARFDGTEEAHEARLILARQYLDAGQPSEAVRVAGAVDAPADVPVGFAARRILAAAQQANGEPEAALATLEELAGSARFGFQSRQVRAAAARIMVDMGRLAEAAAAYETLAEEAEEEDPAEAGVYRIRLGEVRARLQASS